MRTGNPARVNHPITLCFSLSQHMRGAGLHPLAAPQLQLVLGCATPRGSFSSLWRAGGGTQPLDAGLWATNGGMTPQVDPPPGRPAWLMHDARCALHDWAAAHAYATCRYVHVALSEYDCVVLHRCPTPRGSPCPSRNTAIALSALALAADTDPWDRSNLGHHRCDDGMHHGALQMASRCIPRRGTIQCTSSGWMLHRLALLITPTPGPAKVVFVKNWACMP